VCLRGKGSGLLTGGGKGGEGGLRMRGGGRRVMGWSGFVTSRASNNNNWELCFHKKRK